MGRKKKHAEETPPEDAVEPGAAASSGASDDGPLPEDLDEVKDGEEVDDGDEADEDPAADEPDAPPPLAATPPPAPKGAKPKAWKDAKAPEAPKGPVRDAALRARLGEPTPDFPGAIVDPQTGRCENAPPGWDPKRRPPQKP